MQALEIVRAIRQNLRRPSHQQLAEPTVLRSLSDCQRRILREAQLSDRGWMETSVTFNPSSLDDPLNIDNFSVPTRVEYRTGNTEDDWLPVSIVDHEGFSSVTGEAVSFYGTPPRISYGLSQGDLIGREYRLWYETIPDAVVQLSQDIGVGDLFSDFLTDETTLYVAPLVENDSPEFDRFLNRQILLIETRLVETRKQWRKWLNMTRGGVIYSDGFQTSYSNGEAAYIGTDGRLRAS